jgi:type IV pilus assembly protein PilW
MKPVISGMLFPFPAARRVPGGFTLVEVLIGLAVMSIVIVGVLITFRITRQSTITQRQVANMEQQLRGSLYIMNREIRAAGFDPKDAGASTGTPVGITDIRRYDTTGALDPAGHQALTMRFDLDSDGTLETSTYLLYDIGNDGVTDLARTTDGGATYALVSEGVQDIGFAYAMDNDLDGKVDVSANNHILWAVDSDNDNQLDRVLDADDDGDIDDADLTAAAVFLPAPVPVDRIRMVRIWLLCRSPRKAQSALIDNQSYLIGDHIVPAANDTFRRRTLEMTIKCRNLGL